MGKLPFLFQGIKTSEFSAKRGRSRYSCPLPRRITRTCFIFLPTVCHSRAKTISPVRSKYPISFFQLMPHLQCCKPINCCFIFLPQFGHTFLLMPFRFTFGLSASSFFFSFFSSLHPLSPHYPLRRQRQMCIRYISYSVLIHVKVNALRQVLLNLFRVFRNTR